MFPDQGSNSLLWKPEFLATRPPGTSLKQVILISSDRASLAFFLSLPDSVTSVGFRQMAVEERRQASVGLKKERMSVGECAGKNRYIKMRENNCFLMSVDRYTDHDYSFKR